MKYAFMSFSTPEMSLEEMLRAAQSYGYDGIEPRVEQGHTHGVELTADQDARRRIVDTVAASPIEMCCVATGCRYSDPSTVAKNVDDTLRYIDLAADLRCPRLRIFGGPIPEGVSRQHASDS